MHGVVAGRVISRFASPLMDKLSLQFLTPLKYLVFPIVGSGSFSPKAGVLSFVSHLLHSVGLLTHQFLHWWQMQSSFSLFLSTTVPTFFPCTVFYSWYVTFWAVPSTSCCSNTLLQTAVIMRQMLCSSLHTFPLKSLHHLAIEFTLVTTYYPGVLFTENALEVLFWTFVPLCVLVCIEARILSFHPTNGVQMSEICRLPETSLLPPQRGWKCPWSWDDAWMCCGEDVRNELEQPERYFKLCLSSTGQALEGVSFISCWCLLAF